MAAVMPGLRYLPDVATLELDASRCDGCGQCAVVCPHRVFELSREGARITDRDRCMECGACALNCAAGAITVTSGVGCAAAVIQTALGLSSGGCSGDD
jgi:NAD-dependent dihydropyrimidine dehydrogenase PreA subunit